MNKGASEVSYRDAESCVSTLKARLLRGWKYEALPLG